MAEQAQNKLGELFVDIGQTGLGSLVKGLNTLSASFLLGKKGAEEFIKPIANLDKKISSSVIGYDKLSSVTGLSVEKLHQLDVWAQKNHIDFGMLSGTIQTLQQKILQIQTNQGGQLNGLSLLGIDPRSLDADKPLEALDKIMARVNQLQDPAKAAFALDMLGISRDLKYAWEQGNDELDRRLILNKEDLDVLREQNNLWTDLKVTWNEALGKFISKQTWINELLKKCNDWLNNVAVKATDLGKQEWFGQAKEDLKFLIEELKWVGKFLGWINSLLKGMGKAIGTFLFGTGEHGLWEGGLLGKSAASNLNTKDVPISTQIDIQKQYDEWLANYRKQAKEDAKKQEQQQKKQTKEVQKQAAPQKQGYTMQKMQNPLKVSSQPMYTPVQLTPAQAGEVMSSYSLPSTAGLKPAPSTTINMNVTQNITAPDPATAADMSYNKIKEEQQNQLMEYQYNTGI